MSVHCLNRFQYPSCMGLQVRYNPNLASLKAGADPGFLERGFICIKVCVRVALLILSHFS